MVHFMNLLNKNTHTHTQTYRMEARRAFPITRNGRLDSLNLTYPCCWVVETGDDDEEEEAEAKAMR